MPAHAALQRLLARDDIVLLLNQCQQPLLSAIRHVGSLSSRYDIL
jgi:hypothetical protein